MDTDEDKPRQREFMPEDVSALSVQELQDWIAFMQTEIQRAEIAISTKHHVRGDAEALFR